MAAHQQLTIAITAVAVAAVVISINKAQISKPLPSNMQRCCLLTTANLKSLLLQVIDMQLCCCLLSLIT